MKIISIVALSIIYTVMFNIASADNTYQLVRAGCYPEIGVFEIYPIHVQNLDRHFDTREETLKEHEIYYANDNKYECDLSVTVYGKRKGKTQKQNIIANLDFSSKARGECYDWQWGSLTVSVEENILIDNLPFDSCHYVDIKRFTYNNGLYTICASIGGNSGHNTDKCLSGNEKLDNERFQRLFQK
ncbi:MAG: hypothetical protein GKR93_06935 [Gammaproteobacteria bacterium]|nr:hypothetical protein [Gammaproteobacteria bacterium]